MQFTPYIIAISVAVPPLIEKLKNDPNFDFLTPENKERLTAVSILLTSVGSIAVGLEANTITMDSWFGLVQAAVHFVVTFGLAELFYQQVIKRFQKPRQ